MQDNFFGKKKKTKNISWHVPRTNKWEFLGSGCCETVDVGISFWQSLLGNGDKQLSLRSIRKIDPICPNLRF